MAPDPTTQPLSFCFAIHNHQPVGNFGHVFEDVFEQCYRPYLDVLSGFPNIKTAAHFSGPLLEWLEQQRPDYMTQLRRMVESNQLEMLGGGFYEPLLATLPEEDAIGQMRMMSDFIADRFGARPRGLWLAERIWSPALPKIIAQSGYEFTVLDDTHFYYAGLDESQIHGYYITEHQGYPLKLFPISKALRYSIPFELPEVTLDRIRDMRDRFHCTGLTYADDGEKFGSWPETWDWVYGERYLEKWFTALEASTDWLQTCHFGDYLDAQAPTGQVYLPAASYEEMMEWALPIESSRQLHELKATLSGMEISQSLLNKFLRGGQWDNFLTKYPASNQMHKKMIYVSRKVRKLPDSHPKKAEALKALYRGQCNCSYWHGLFGGLYLNYLRHAVYFNLILAETIADEGLNEGGLRIDYVDIDLDGQNEFVVSNQEMSVIVAPARGGAVMEFDFRPARFNITNVLGRLEETYHQSIRNEAANSHQEDEAPKSIHDRIHFKQEGLEECLIYDRSDRFSVQDHWIEPGTELEQLKSERYEEKGDLIGAPFGFADSLSESLDAGQIILTKEARLGEGLQPIRFTKRFSFDNEQAIIRVNYELQHLGDQAVQGSMGVEFNASLLAGDAPDRYFVDEKEPLEDAHLCSEGDKNDRLSWQMRDDWSKISVSWQWEVPARVMYYPIETVSQSEGGFEKTYQGSCIWVLWAIKLSPGETLRRELVWSVSKV